MISLKFLAVAVLASYVLAGSPAAALATKVTITNREPSENEIGYLPADNSTVSINPPPIAWLDSSLATSWTLEVSSNSDFSSPVVSVSNWPWLMYTHSEALPAGTYYWRYSYVTFDMARSGWSKVRQFTVAPDATVFPRPSAAQLQELIPGEHPRMFTRPEKLAALQQTAGPENANLKNLLKSADAYLDDAIMAEPKPWTDGKWNAGEWGNYLRQASAASRQINTLAFAWLLTGEQKYGSRAKAHLMEYASWDPHGPSSMKVNDEVGMPMLYSISRAYDWLHPLLSDDEKEIVRQHMRERGEETYRRLRKKPYEQFVYNSHFGRMFHFLGEAGLSFYGEIPEAEKWLNYAMTIFYGWYPYWGREDGGWAEGIHYWTSYNTRVTWWLDLLQESLGIDGSAKPFYANVADFPLFVFPPGNPVAGFGDFSERPPSLTSVGRTVAAYAMYRDNSNWQWYAEEASGDLGSGPFGYIRGLRKQPEAVEPSNLPLLKLFDKVGYAIFHTDLSNPDKNLHVAMRSSPLGNVSHSHNDQNAIVMSAFGEPLLVNTGTRDFYGSPFCKEYYWQTQSHNSILFDGHGQRRAKDTPAQFVASGEETGKLAYVVGDATRAYPEFVKQYRRWLIFLPDAGALVLDEFKTTASTATVLYHGRAPFELEEFQGGFELTKGKVRLDGKIQFVSGGERFKLTQTDEYPLPLGNNKKPLFKEWHLKADGKLSGDASETQLIFTWLGVDDKPAKKNAFNWDNWATVQMNDQLGISRNSKNGPSIELEIDLSKLTVKRTK